MSKVYPGGLSAGPVAHKMLTALSPSAQTLKFSLETIVRDFAIYFRFELALPVGRPDRHIAQL